MELAREIENTQRQQSSTLQYIVKRLRELDSTRSASGSAAGSVAGAPGSRAGSPAETFAPSAASDDDPWDRASAEALMLTYEVDETGSETVPPQAPSPEASHTSGAHGWFGQPFHDVTQRIKRTLHDLRPGSTIALLEERLDQFQHHINLALEDVVRRADLDGLRRIEEHVSDLGEQLHLLERHVQRFDTLEADVRTVMEQVSDERLAKLLDYNERFAADLDSVAMRAAEEVHGRLGKDAEDAGARRHEELTALIEAAIQDRRQAETQASSMVAELSGQVTQQADQYNEIKSLLEDTRREQRESEQTALGMLDTLQQALVRVLDRMDALEQQHMTPPPVPAETAAPAPEASFGAAAEASAAFVAPETEAVSAPAFGTSSGEDQIPAFSSQADTDGVMPQAEVPAAFAAPVDADAVSAEPVSHGTEDSGAATIERLRRDFIADARRAKLRAAANRAEAKAETASAAWRMDVDREADDSRAGRAIASGTGRRFSPKLLAGILAIVVAINGALLLFKGKESPAPAVPEINAPAPEPSNREPGDADEDATVPGKSSSLGGPGMVTPYGDLDDVLNPPQAVPVGEAASAPLGTTIVSAAVTQHDEGVANIYEQQLLAGLSKQLGAVAAQQTPDAMLPENNGRIINPIITASVDRIAADPAPLDQGSALDLPPATVGPLSLRLAAANGDASAEFEVAARLAAGKGTSQNFAEAARWYQRSAAKGFAQSQYRLGTFYERGLGVGKDLSRARIWYGRAAEQGNVKSMHNLAVLAAGHESAPDYKTALRWFTSAAEHGLADSQFNLGVIYENGVGVAADPAQAYKWYALAAKAGDSDAKGLRDALKAKMSADDRAKAARLVASFRARVPSRLANDALAAGEDWKQRAEDGSDS